MTKPQGRTILRAAGYLLAMALGFWWYLVAADSAGCPSLVDLGVVQLMLVVFGVFFTVGLASGFTISRVFLLVVPVAICSFLIEKLLVWETLGSKADFGLLRLQAVGAFLYLSVVLVWIAVFPFPVGWRPQTNAGAIGRRLEWALVALAAGGLAVAAWFAFSMISVASSPELWPGVPLADEDMLHEPRQFVAGRLQSQALSLYLLLIVKSYLRVEVAEKLAAGGDARNPLGDMPATS